MKAKRIAEIAHEMAQLSKEIIRKGNEFYYEGF